MGTNGPSPLSVVSRVRSDGQGAGNGQLANFIQGQLGCLRWKATVSNSLVVSC